MGSRPSPIRRVRVLLIPGSQHSPKYLKTSVGVMDLASESAVLGMLPRESDK